MAELVMRKRPAMHAGEIGLFIDSQVFEDDFANIRSNVDLKTKVTQPHNLRQFRLAWALAGKIALSGILGDFDKDETMEWLLTKCKHVKYRYNKHRDGGEELEVVVKSIRWEALEQEAFNRIFNRMIYIITSEILPNMTEGALRDEIENMAGVDTPEPERRKPGRPRKPVSIIPADEPVSPPMAPQPLPSETPAPPTPAAHDAAAQAPYSTPLVFVPKNPEEWVTFATAWITAMATDPKATSNDMMVRWSAELKLRNACGLTSELRTPVFEFYAKTLEKKMQVR